MPIELSAAGRLRWIDVAKGFCITFVVFHHSYLWYDRLFLHGASTVAGEFAHMFGSLRMPLFFLISGFLASEALAKGWRHTSPKTIGLYLIYLVWESGLQTRALLSGKHEESLEQVVDWIVLVLPGTLWFIWALPVYYVIGLMIDKRLRRSFEAKAAFLAGLALLAVASPMLFEPGRGLILPERLRHLTILSVLTNCVWFFSGVYGKPLWNALIANAQLARMLKASVLFILAYVTLRLCNVEQLFVAALAPLALLCASQALGLLNYEAPLARVFERIGKETLPVYVMHLFFFSALNKVASFPSVRHIIGTDPMVMSTVLPLVLTPIIIAITIAGGRVIVRSPARFLIEPFGLRKSKTTVAATPELA